MNSRRSGWVPSQLAQRSSTESGGDGQQQKVIKSVLRGFLGTYASRYNDYRGYWLFGLLVSDLDELVVNLLSPGAIGRRAAMASARSLAATKFEDQVLKAGLRPEQIREARLRIKRSPEVARGSVNGHPCVGWLVTFHAGAVMDNDRRYECEQVLFVAPHDPQVERRRLEKDWGS